MLTPLEARERYRIAEAIQDNTYRAYDTVRDCDVRLRVFPGSHHNASLERFFGDCERIAGVSHPDVLPILDWGEIELHGTRQPFLSNPFEALITLQELLTTQRPPLETAFDWLSHVCRGLEAAHARGVAHGSLNPSEVLIRPGGSAMISGFAAARLADPAHTEIDRHRFAHLAPEQVLGEAPSAASDAFSFGVMAYEVVTGVCPFIGASRLEIAAGLVTQVPASASTRNSAVPAHLSAAVHLAMAKKQHDRLAAMQNFADAAATALAQNRVETERIPSRFPEVGAGASTKVAGGDLHSRSIATLASNEPDGPLGGPAAFSTCDGNEVEETKTRQFPLPLLDYEPATDVGRAVTRPAAVPQHAAAAVSEVEPACDTAPSRRIQNPGAESPARRLRWWIPAALAGGLVLTFALLFAFTHSDARSAPAAAQAVPVNIRLLPGDAEVRINGAIRAASDLKLRLAPGTYRVEVSRAGYHPATADMTVAHDSPATLDIKLRPLAHALRLYTDLRKGVVLLDGSRAGELSEGQFQLDAIPAGDHTLRIKQRGRHVTLAFHVEDGSGATITSFKSRRLSGLAVTDFAGTARVHATAAQASVGLDGNAVGLAGAHGLEASNLSAGTHEISLEHHDERHSFLLTIGPLPAITAFVKSDRNVGSLIVVAGENGAKVILNGREYDEVTRRGQLRIPDLPTREYTVRVVKEGFQQLPEQRVVVHKGQDTRLEFRLRAAHGLASLRASGLTGTP
jgi:serine/threonine protein kinase